MNWSMKLIYKILIILQVYKEIGKHILATLVQIKREHTKIEVSVESIGQWTWYEIIIIPQTNKEITSFETVRNILATIVQIKRNNIQVV